MTTVILPVLNEVCALNTTIDVLLRENPETLARIIAVICDRTHAPSVEMLRKWKATHPTKLDIVQQNFGRLGGALRTGIEHVRSEHAILMFGDLESDPHAVKQLIEVSAKHPRAIISASRWLPEGGFDGYPLAKLMGNWCFQKIARGLRCGNLTDFTFGFRLYPTEVLRAFAWRSENHDFVLESILRPIGAGVSVIEVPGRWRRRDEGNSVQNFGGYVPYFQMLLKDAMTRMWTRG